MQNKQKETRGMRESPPTEPALPPITSASTLSDAPHALVPVAAPAHNQLPTWVHRNVQRDMALANDPATTSASGKMGTLSAPMIIPGDPTSAIPMPGWSRRRPRSRAVHLALFAFTTCLMLLILYAAAPLTAGATDRLGAFLGGTGAYAIPTPTPTLAPTPTPVRVYGGTANNPGTQAIINQIVAIFGPYANSALAIVRCESGFNPNAYNPTPVLGSHAEGVFQILYPITWSGTSQAAKSPYDANANIQAAHDIFTRDGNSWREWACAGR